MPHEPLPNPILEARRQRRYLLLGVRVVFLLVILSVAFLHLFAQKVAPSGPAEWIPFTAPISVAVVVFIIAIVIDLATPNKKLSTIFGIFIGLLVAMVATYALGLLVDLIIRAWIGDDPIVETFKPYAMILKLMLGITLCYLAITTILQTQDDIRLVLPYIEFSKQIRGVKPTILDTSALVDARITDIAATGLLQSTLVIPKFVLAELQALADSADRLKRARGRRGLDVVARLQRLGTIGVNIDDTPVPESSVDQRLVELARLLSARILTGDLALTRVAQIHGVTVLNLHELANAFKPALIPGEQLVIRIVKPGEQAGQGVGYLEDGTMVVTEGGANRIGEEVHVLVTSTMQTTAGRMIFAKASENDASAAQSEADAAPAGDDESTGSEQRAPAGTEPVATPVRRSPLGPGPSRRGPTGTPRNPRR